EEVALARHQGKRLRVGGILRGQDRERVPVGDGAGRRDDFAVRGALYHIAGTRLNMPPNSRTCHCLYPRLPGDVAANGREARASAGGAVAGLMLATRSFHWRAHTENISRRHEQNVKWPRHSRDRLFTLREDGEAGEAPAGRPARALTCAGEGGCAVTFYVR